MSNGIIESQKAYWTREVANILDIKEGTVRNYSRLMEDFGYQFHKNENDQRVFFESDLLIMKRMQSLSKIKGVTLEDAVSAVLSTHYKPSQEVMTPPVMEIFSSYVITQYGTS